MSSRVSLLTRSVLAAGKTDKVRTAAARKKRVRGEINFAALLCVKVKVFISAQQ